MKLFGVIGFIFLSLILGCKKEDSTLKGRITYKGKVSGIEYPASNARVNLYQGFTSGDPVATVTTDSDGYYVFNDLWEAPKWVITGEITENGIKYTGNKETNSLTGKNTVTLDLLLE